METKSRGAGSGHRPLRRLRRRVRRHRRRAWERREQRYYRRHSAKIGASLRHSHLQPSHRAHRHTPSTQCDTERAKAPELRADRAFTAAIVALAAAGGALAGCHPTGTQVIDPVETAVFAAGFTLLVSRAAPGVGLVVGITGLLFARGWLLVPAAVAAGVALGGVLVGRTRRWAGGVVGALGVQVVLRWPAHLFHGFTAAVAAALVVLCAVSAWQRSSHRTRSRAMVIAGAVAGVAVVCCLGFAVATLLVRSQALRGETAARTALADAGSQSTPSVVSGLTTAADDTNHAARVLDSWMALGARAVPVVAQQERFLAGTLRAASSAATVGGREAAALEPQLGSEPGRVDLTRLTALETPMRILDNQLHKTVTQLRAAGSPWLVGPLQDRATSFTTQVAQVTHDADLGVEATRVMPAMLGADGTRHYLIAFVTPSESRGYDGLIGSYGLLTAEAGHISLSASGNITNIQDALPKGGARLSGVPDYLARYGAFAPGSNPEDAMYAPDLPTDAKVFAQLYDQSLGAGLPIDGVLAIDPYGLAALLHFTGPINVPGLPFPLTQANAAQVLLTREYTQFDVGETNPSGDLLRRDFLESALQVAFQTLTSRSLPAPKDLSAVLDPAAMEGRISFWSFHDDEQPFLHHLGLAGAFPQAKGGDLLAVTTQNTGNNKIDAFLHTSIDDHVTFNPGTGTVRSALRVTLTNDAPASALPPVIIGNPGDPSLASGINETWLTVYSPLSFGHVTVNGSPATMSATPELGVWAYSTYVDIAPRASTTVRVELLGSVVAGKTLRMSVRLQPSANPVRAQVVVTPSGPWSLANGHSGQWTLGSGMSQTRVARFAPK